MKKIIGCLSICCLVAGCPQTDEPTGGDNGVPPPTGQNPSLPDAAVVDEEQNEKIDMPIIPYSPNAMYN